MKSFLYILLILIIFLCPAYREYPHFKINAERDAYNHNNIALNHLHDKAYYAAIQEFRIAISLSPNTQMTSVFKTNLGKTYMTMGYPDLAKQPFEEALQGYKLNFQYYFNLAECYEKLGLIQTKINEYSNSTSPFDKIMLGILYIQSGQKRRGIIILDDVCQIEPDLMITPAIRQYLKEKTKEP